MCVCLRVRAQIGRKDHQSRELLVYLETANTSSDVALNTLPIYFFPTRQAREAYHDPRLGSIGLRARDIIFVDGSVEKRRLCTAVHRMRFWLVPSAGISIASSHLPVNVSAQPDTRRTSHPPLLAQSPHLRLQQVICKASSLISGVRG